jgi:3D (Asp-Asp-Asp) domain-containing protein
MTTIQAAVPSAIKRTIALGMTMSLLHVSLAVAEPSVGIEGSAALKNDAAVTAPAEAGIEYRRMTVTATAYNPWDEGQTDDTPCYGPRGILVCGPEMRVIAANFLPLGTKVLIDGEIYTVYDRTAPKYKDRVDIAFQASGDTDQARAESKTAARKFGKQTKEIIVLN